MSDRLSDLLAQAEQRASMDYGGHLTILKFTTGWKAMFGTPDLDTGSVEVGRGAREHINDLPNCATIEEALESLLVHGWNVYS